MNKAVMELTKQLIPYLLNFFIIITIIIIIIKIYNNIKNK